MGSEMCIRDSDTAIGYALEADKKLELAPGTKLAEAFNDVLAEVARIEAILTKRVD